MVVRSGRALLHGVLYTFVTLHRERCASVFLKTVSASRSARARPSSDGLFQVFLRADKAADGEFCLRKKRPPKSGGRYSPNAGVIDATVPFPGATLVSNARGHDP